MINKTKNLTNRRLDSKINPGGFLSLSGGSVLGRTTHRRGRLFLFGAKDGLFSGWELSGAKDFFISLQYRYASYNISNPLYLNGLAIPTNIVKSFLNSTVHRTRSGHLLRGAYRVCFKQEVSHASYSCIN